jgi:truncated hemoglobin YjbI
MEESVTYEAMGGQSALVKINNFFYDKIYQHPWLK